MKRIVIVGAGYGGIKSALHLHRILRKEKDIEIILIDKNHYHTMLTETHEVAGHRIEEDGIKYSLSHILEYTKVRLVQDEIKGFDFREKRIYSDLSEYKYDYLILAAGSESFFPKSVEGLREYAYTLWSVQEAVKTREHIKEVFKRAALTRDKEIRRSLLTISVCGGGFTGVEMIGELIRWTGELANQHRIPKDEVCLYLLEGLDRICPHLDDDLALKVRRYIEKHGVEVITGEFVTSVEEGMVKTDKNRRIPCHTIIWTAGIRGNSIFEGSGLPLTDCGRIEVDQTLEVPGFPGVYAVGDNCSLEYPPGSGKVIPALVESALQTGKIAADNIAADIKGRPKRECVPHLHGVMVSIGRHFGVANAVGMKLTGIWVILMKHLVNLHYLFEIGGFEFIFNYIRHEFFEIKREYRGIAEEQATIQRPLIFLVPLRLYLGYMWLIDGYTKIMDNWWNSIVLREVAFAPHNPTIIDVGGTASGAVQSLLLVDTVSGATYLDLISDHTPWWYAWFVEKVIYPNALFFQRVIIITEIALGLAFIFGLFVVIAALVSLALNMNFLLTTGLYDYWYIAASIAMLAGAGSVLGLDYFVLPCLMRQWRYFTRNRGLALRPSKGSG